MRIGAMITVLAFAAGSAVALAAPASATVGSATIHGRVFKSTTGHGVGAVRVTAWAPDATEPIARADTAPDGEYTLSVPTPAHGYYVCFSGYSLTHRGAVYGWANQCYQDAPNPAGVGSAPGSDATLVSVHADHVTSGINAIIRPAGAIDGSLTLPDDLARSAHRYTARAYDSHGREFASHWPHADGTFEIKGLPAGQYTVCLRLADPGYGATSHTYPYGAQPSCLGNVPWLAADRAADRPSTAATYVAVGTGAVTAIDPVTPGPAAGVTGTITSSTGAPLILGAVRVFDSAGALVATGYDDDGGYDVSGLDGGSTVTVCVDARQTFGGTSRAGYTSQCGTDAPWQPGVTPVRLPPGATPVTVAAGTAATVNFVLTNGAAIHGRVTDASGRVVHGLVTVRSRGGQVLAGTVAGRFGKYKVVGLARNRTGYYVCVDAGSRYQAQCWDDVPWAGGDAPVPPAATLVPAHLNSATTGIDFELAAAG